MGQNFRSKQREKALAAWIKSRSTYDKWLKIYLDGRTNLEHVLQYKAELKKAGLVWGKAWRRDNNV